MKFRVEMNEFLPLRDVVFRSLQQAILNGELKPGEHLLETVLAEKLGVSRTPVREAIRKLELEGLVIVMPRKGAIVSEITKKNLRDVLEVRRALEELAARLACKRASKEQISDIKKRAKEFEKALEDKSITEIAKADAAFHYAIYEATDNDRLMHLLNNLREQMYRYRIEYLRRKDAYPILLKEHTDMVCEIEQRNPKGAINIAKAHIDNQEEAIIDLLEMPRSIKQEIAK